MKRFQICDTTIERETAKKIKKLCRTHVGTDASVGKPMGYAFGFTMLEYCTSSPFAIYVTDHRDRTFTYDDLSRVWWERKVAFFREVLDWYSFANDNTDVVENKSNLEP
jgi:hypothetical protein